MTTTPDPHSPHANEPFSTPTRLLALTLAHLVAKPVLWLIYRLGGGERLWVRVVEKMRDNVVAGHDFGDYQPTAHDVIVCTYPKCGTNWAMQIAHQIAMRGDGEYEHIHDVVPWPDFTRQELIVPLSDERVRKTSPTGLRVIKTHLEWERVPYTQEARYICILRDPKDAFVSSYHFLRDVFFGPLMAPVDIWLKLFCSRAFPFVWSVHLHGYWKNRGRPNLLILTFEEMKSDLEGAIRRIAKFMDVELTDAEFEKVREKSSFGYMKVIGHKFKPPALTPLASPHRELIRRGASGGSSELLSSDQQIRIDDFFRADLRALGSDFPYDDTWGSSTLVH